MKKIFLILSSLIILILSTGCHAFNSYKVDGDCTVKTFWVENLDDFPEYEKFMVDEGNNYLAIDIFYETSSFEVSNGARLEDFQSEIEIGLPYGHLYKTKLNYRKNKNGNYCLGKKIITSIKDEDMYVPDFHCQFNFRIYDVSMIVFDGYPYNIYPQDNEYMKIVFFTYPDGTTPEDWRVYDNE